MIGAGHTEARAREIAAGFLHSSIHSLCRRHDIACEVIYFARVGERHVSERDDLPSWAWMQTGDAPAIIYPSELARIVATLPETLAAAMSPGERKELTRALSEENDDGAIFWPDDVGDLDRSLVHRSTRLDRIGWLVWLTDLGRSVAAAIEEA